ncbi:MAG: 4Fe-4S binding protein [Firmicutes bacterium]|nr:4Fe-4S binding protein [Bacillota bacterium]
MSDMQEKLSDRILSILPGTNCNGLGGCGKATCRECAEAIAGGESIALCPACSQEQVDQIAEATGRDPVPVQKKVAFIACSGHATGIERHSICGSCEAAKAYGFVRGECKSGCLGIGDCVDVCTFDATELADGVVSIDREKCTGCGACAHASTCIQNIIYMVPADATNFIPCSSTEEDEDVVRKTCGYGCISCGECERACPVGAVSIVNYHAVIDYDKCEGCEACAVKCRKKIIIDEYHDITKLKEKVAFVACNGGFIAGEIYESKGYHSCAEAVKSADPKDLGLCTTGCTGLGDCTEVCRYDAIHVEYGTAFVDVEKCVGCKDCTFACPKGLISIVPYKGAKMVPCSSVADYEEKSDVCPVCCESCMDCINNCPNGAIYLEDRHAVVDLDLCENCNICQYVCFKGVIAERAVPEYNYLQRDALGIGKESE